MFNRIFLICIIAFISFLPVANSSNSIKNPKVVDLEKVYSSMPEMKIAQKKFQEEVNKFQTAFQRKVNEYMSLTKALESKDLPDIKRKALEKKVNSLQEELRTGQERMQSKAIESKIKYISPIEEKVKKIVASNAKKNGIPFVIGFFRAGGTTVLLYFNESADITSNIISILKKNK